MLRNPSTTYPFLDPYEGQHDGRMSFDVVRREWEWFRSIDNTPRSREIMLSILLSKLKNELQRIGITEYNPTAFKSAIAGLVIICPDPRKNGEYTGLMSNLNGQFLRSTVANSVPAETNSGHDRPGTRSVPQFPPSTPPQPTSPQSSPSRPSEASGGKSKGKGGKSKVGQV